MSDPIQTLANDPNDYDAIQELEAQVAAASEIGADNGALQDWLADGDFDGSETVESIAAEWDGDRE